MGLFLCLLVVFANSSLILLDDDAMIFYEPTKVFNENDSIRFTLIASVESIFKIGFESDQNVSFIYS
jgi:hypothetical protein